MESQKTKILLEKYWLGETTAEEEILLQENFKQELDEGDGKYSVIFDYKSLLKGEEAETFDLSFLDEVEVERPNARFLNLPNKSQWKTWAAGLAASVIIASFSLSYQWPRTQTLQAKSIEMERAYTETLAALQLVASNLNKGNESIHQLSVFDRTTKHIIHEN